MQADLCDFHNEVKRRRKDGTFELVVRCADPGCEQFTKVVDADWCGKCPRHDAKQREREALKRLGQEKLVPEMPSLIRRAVSWSEAVAGWITAGRPERSDEEVRALYDKFCKSCAWRDPEKDACRGCGCGVRKGGVAIFNKIKMATQHCPRRMW